MPPIPKNKTGVYIIRNRINKKVYVGSATRSLAGRWKEHRLALIGRRHFNKHLQAAWNLYGGSAFEFLVTEYCSIQKCLEREQHWIDWYRAADTRFGYNSRPRAESNLGARFGPQSDETKERKSKSLKKNWASGTRKSVSHTDETKAKIGLAFKGKKISEERKLKMIGRKLSEEHKMRIAESQRGKERPWARIGHPCSEETKAKLRAKHLGKVLTPEHIEKMAASKRGKPWTLARRLACRK